MLAVTIPASDIEVGGTNGQEALSACRTSSAGSGTRGRRRPPRSPSRSCAAASSRRLTPGPCRHRRDRPPVLRGSTASTAASSPPSAGSRTTSGRHPGCVPDSPGAVPAALRRLVHAGALPADPRRAGADVQRDPGAVGRQRRQPDDHAGHAAAGRVPASATSSSSTWTTPGSRSSTRMSRAVTPRPRRSTGHVRSTGSGR